MPLSPSLTTGAMIAGTVLTAAGLNLGVLSLNQPPTGDGQTVEASETAAAPVEAAVEATVTPLVDPAAGVDPAQQDQPLDDTSTTGGTTTDGVAGAAVQVVTAPAATSDAGRSSGAAAPSSSAAPTTKGTEAPTTKAPTTQAPATAAPRTDAPTTQRPTTSKAPTTKAPTTAAPTTAAPTTAAPTTPAPTDPQRQTEYLTYEWDGIAEIIFAFHDGSTLEFWSAAPENNWVYLVEKRTGKEVEVKFFNTRTKNEAKFKAEVNNGRVKISKES